MLVRLGDVGVVCVLNDAGAAVNAVMETLRKLTGPLAPLQWREVLAHLSYANILLKNRPRFHTTFGRHDGSLTISADVPARIELLDFAAPDFGNILYSVLSSALEVVPFAEQAFELTTLDLMECQAAVLTELYVSKLVLEMPWRFDTKVVEDLAPLWAWSHLGTNSRRDLFPMNQWCLIRTSC